MVPLEGLEPPTTRLQGGRATIAPQRHKTKILHIKHLQVFYMENAGFYFIL